jgi:hypothetical protein
MRTKRFFRSAWVVTFAGAAAGCDSGEIGNPAPPEREYPDSAGVANDCPTAEPELGASCPIPNIDCGYHHSCSYMTYECSGDTWTSLNAPACPDAKPTGECDCYPLHQQCAYPTGMCNGMPRSEVSVCVNGQWTPVVAYCNPSDGGTDAAPDASDSSIDAITDASNDTPD